jgi:hypothetical protein
MDSDEATWLSAFQVAASGEVPQSSEANQWLGAELDLGGPKRLDICISIMGQEDLALSVRVYAALACARLLTPRNHAMLLTIRASWGEDSQLADKVKRVLYTTVLCDDERMRAQAARCFALVFGIEGEAWVGGLDDVIKFLSTCQGNATAVLGLFSVFKEILGLSNFALDLVQSGDLRVRYAQLFTAGLDILQSPENVPTPVRAIAAVCIKEAIAVIPAIFGTTAEERIERVNVVLNALPNSLRVLNEDLFKDCHRIMYHLFKHF